MQLHVPAPQLHFPPATPPRLEPALLSPGRRPDFILASLFNTDQSVPAIFQSAPFGGVVQTRFHARIPCSALPARRSPRVSCRLALFRSLMFLSPPGRIVAKHISPLAYGSGSLIAAPCPHKAIRKYYSNLIRIRSRNVAQGGIQPLLRMPARRLAGMASCRYCARQRDDSPTSPNPVSPPVSPAFPLSRRSLRASCHESTTLFLI